MNFDVNTDPNVHQKARRASPATGWATAIAVDSSIVPCAASIRRSPRTCSSGASRIAYRELRAPSSRPLPSAAAALPPPAITPTTANWVPPVKASSDSRQVCSADSPAATDAAPNANP